MAIITVSTLSDSVANDGQVSLREAIQAANTDSSVDGSAAGSGVDTIAFAAGLNGTIRLDGGDGAGGAVGGTLSITDDLTIDGDGRITITGDVNNDDTTVGTTDITDIFVTASAALDDNVRIMDAEDALTLRGLTLTGGVATGTEEDGSGGAVRADDVTLDGVTVSGNSAEYTGGGIYANWTASIVNSVVDGNVSGDAGGGVDAFTATVIASTFSGNQAAGSGGGLQTSFDANVTGSTFSGNSTTFSGGAISAFTINLNNATLSGNSAGGEGGGVSGFTANIINSTISGNFAGLDGGGSAAGDTNLTNSIVFGNDSPGAKDVYSAFGATLSGGNIVHGEFTIDGQSPEAVTVADVFASVVTLDPDGAGGRNPFDAGALADNGGPVQTIALKEDASNPALDGGDDSLAPGLDARGFSRADVAGAANNGANISDLGAFEASHDIVVTTLLDVVDASDDLISLREAVGLANANSGADTITFDPSLNGTIRLDGGDGAGGTVGGTLSTTGAITINGDGRILITGDVAGDDVLVAGTGITDIFASQTADTLADNVQIFNAATLTLEGLVLTGGVTSSIGGAIVAAVVTLTNTTVSGNNASFLGGGMNAIAATLSNSTVSGNSAGTDGGGISAGNVELTNSTVSGNNAGRDGGGIDAGGTATLTNSTISGNSAGVDGGGISVSLGSVNLTNSIVLGNDATTDDEIAGPVSAAGGLNIVGVGADTDGGDGVINAASVGAVFAAVDGTTGGGQLADNGGPVQTIALKRDLSNPALDKSNASAPANDARGEARQDWAGIANSNGSPADLGAFELQNTAPTATNLAQAKSFIEDAASVALDDIVVSDADVGDSITARLTLANAAAGALTTSGAATYNAGTGVWTITGTVAEVNAALAAVAFTPAADNALDTTITTHIEDAAGAGPADGTITLDATPANDAPVITSNGGGPAAAVNVAENTRAVTIVAAADIDSATLTYAIAGGADAARFVINAVTGALSFSAAPDFEAPGDAGGDNVYAVIVQASDGTLIDTQAIAVTVTNVAGVIINGTGGNDIVKPGTTVPGQPLPTGEEDVIRGDGGDDALVGAGGNDRLIGGAGDDKLFGSRGDEGLFGGAGDDRLRGGAGKDSLDGGAGSDTAFYWDRGAAISVVLKGAAETVVRVGGVIEDTLAGVENVRGGAFADTLIGDGLANRLMGEGGGDTLRGADGDDRLIGGLGGDEMTGGAGADDFRFLTLAEMGNTAATRDVIADFRVGIDDIDLFAIDANGSAAGHRFIFLAAEGEAFNNVRGELRWFQVDVAGTANDRTIVAGDTTGDGVADFQIELTGLKNLTAGDFLL